jgi:NAD+ diphosphatase
MSSSIFETNSPHDEPSQLTAFSINTLDRRSEHRNEGELQEALKSDNTRYFAFAQGNALVKNGQTILTLSDIEPFEPDFENAAIIGWTHDGSARITVSIDLEEDQLKDDLQLLNPRTIYSDDLLKGDLLGQLAQAASINAWINSTMFCGKCGAKTMPKAGGYNRQCTSCERPHFPRTDPVVIMLIIDEEGDRCLMGRSPHFATQMYSTLAGFVEPGETIEDAVRRETLEESGIKVGRVRYHASQPWPMPHTLMIGCIAEALNTEINYDSEELEDCRWFSREEVAHRLQHSEGDDRLSPPKGAIAHRLLQDWLDWR